MVEVRDARDVVWPELRAPLIELRSCHCKLEVWSRLSVILGMAGAVGCLKQNELFEGCNADAFEFL